VLFVKNVTSIEDTVKKMTKEEIIKLVSQLPNNKQLHKEAENVCYNRLLCDMIGIDYNSITSTDYARAYIYCYWRETDG